MVPFNMTCLRRARCVSVAQRGTASDGFVARAAAPMDLAQTGLRSSQFYIQNPLHGTGLRIISDRAARLWNHHADDGRVQAQGRGVPSLGRRSC